MVVQKYEKYWKFTVAFTNYNGKKFLDTLRICVNFIDKNKKEKYNKIKYEKLQIEVKDHLKISMISVRKAINQLVKMGFINSFLASYNPDSIYYLNAKTNRRRQSVLSKIIYSNSSFSRSINEDSKQQEINFLIKTLEENGKLHKNDVISLMMIPDVSKIKKGYLTEKELIKAVLRAKRSGFIKRKYNQVGYLWGLLKKLDDLVIRHDLLYFEEDARVILDYDFKKGKQRDQYLHRIFKNQLKEESNENLGGIKCMLEKLSYPTLVASHIKPFVKSSENEAYDSENGLLLSQNMDGLFDKGCISFNDDGSIIVSNKIDKELIICLLKYKLDKSFLSDVRKKYLNYHRDLFKGKLGID